MNDKTMKPPGQCMVPKKDVRFLVIFILSLEVWSLTYILDIYDTSYCPNTGWILGMVFSVSVSLAISK